MRHNRSARRRKAAAHDVAAVRDTGGGENRCRSGDDMGKIEQNTVCSRGHRQDLAQE
jgi:hypothetical protein